MIKVDIMYVNGDIAHMDVEKIEYGGSANVIILEHKEHVVEVIPFCNVLSVVINASEEDEGE
jgi:hypothetical protein